MKRILLASALASLILSCTPPEPASTGDSVLDAELRTLQVHEERMAHYGKVIDSLGCITPRSPAQDSALHEAETQQEWHETQWNEASQRAMQRAQGNWNRICPLKRNAGMSCND